MRKISEQTVYVWRRHFAGLAPADMKRLKALKLELPVNTARNLQGLPCHSVENGARTILEDQLRQGKS